MVNTDVRVPADGTPQRPFGGPTWNSPPVDKDGRVSRPAQATFSMYGNPAPSRYSLPETNATLKRAPIWRLNHGDAGKVKTESLGLGPAGYDQDPRMRRTGRDRGRHAPLSSRFPELSSNQNPPPYPNSDAESMKKLVSTMPREPVYSIRRDIPVRIGSYIPGPAFYPIRRFPKKLPQKTPQRGPMPIVSFKPELLTSRNITPAPNNYHFKNGDAPLQRRAPQFTMRPRRRDPEMAERSPGPAAYHTEAIDAVRKRVPSYSFRINGSNYINMLGYSDKKEHKKCFVPPRHGALMYGKNA